MVFCEDELLTPEPISKRSFYTEFPGYDEYAYCVRVVYNDYAMSEPQCVLVDAPMQCVAPRNLYSQLTVNENGEYVSPNEIIAILLKYLKIKISRYVLNNGYQYSSTHPHYITILNCRHTNWH